MSTPKPFATRPASCSWAIPALLGVLFLAGSNALGQSAHNAQLGHNAAASSSAVDSLDPAEELTAMAMMPLPGAAAPAPRQAEDPVRISGGVMAGQLVSRVNPTYPPEARAKGVQGAVVLSARIAKDGTVQDLNVISGPAQLASAAIDAVRQWVYKPYNLNGNAVDVLTTITVNFNTGH